jgi:hypothetical protein
VLPKVRAARHLLEMVYEPSHMSGVLQVEIPDVRFGKRRHESRREISMIRFPSVNLRSCENLNARHTHIGLRAGNGQHGSSEYSALPKLTQTPGTLGFICSEAMCGYDIATRLPQWRVGVQLYGHRSAKQKHLVGRIKA